MAIIGIDFGTSNPAAAVGWGRWPITISTSQKLAQRIVCELKQRFRGDATAWPDDATLFATWKRER